MIQDIAPRKLNNQYDPSAVVDAADRIVCLYEDAVLIKRGNELDFPRYRELPDSADKKDFTYLFSVDTERYFLYRKGKANAAEDCRYLSLKDFRNISMEPQYRVYALYTAKHLADWYRDNAFCGRCGKKMYHSDTERCMVCDCGNHSYPRIMPAVIVGVINGDKILLTRYRTGFGHNALIAGFTEIGETFEECVEREVMEEAGVRVKNIRYYKSQPWGTANDILAGFYCDVDGDDTISMDSSELRFAQWVKREDIELQPNNYSLTNEMMTMFKDGAII